MGIDLRQKDHFSSAILQLTTDVFTVSDITFLVATFIANASAANEAPAFTAFWTHLIMIDLGYVSTHCTGLKAAVFAVESHAI